MIPYLSTRTVISIRHYTCSFSLSIFLINTYSTASVHYLINGISKTYQSLIDMFYRRLLKFVFRCLSSRSFVVNFIARHSILFCRLNSKVGRNVLSCCQRYSTNIVNVVRLPVSSILRTLIVLPILRLQSRSDVK